MPFWVIRICQRMHSCIETLVQSLLQHWSRMAASVYCCIFTLVSFPGLVTSSGWVYHLFTSSDKMAFPVTCGRPCFQDLCKQNFTAFQFARIWKKELLESYCHHCHCQGTTALSSNSSKGVGFWSRKAFKYRFNFMSSPVKASECNGINHMLKVKSVIHRSSLEASL